MLAGFVLVASSIVSHIIDQKKKHNKTKQNQIQKQNINVARLFDPWWTKGPQFKIFNIYGNGKVLRIVTVREMLWMESQALQGMNFSALKTKCDIYKFSSPSVQTDSKCEKLNSTIFKENRISQKANETNALSAIVYVRKLVKVTSVLRSRRNFTGNAVWILGLMALA